MSRIQTEQIIEEAMLAFHDNKVEEAFKLLNQSLLEDSKNIDILNALGDLNYLSENIRVRSIVGQFLEHHRIFYFYAHGKEEVYLSSADWMDRNLFRRIEVAFPILDPELKQKVINEGLNELLKDVSSWNMNADGLYKQSIPSSNVKLSGQQNLLLKYSVAAQPVKRKLKT
jgi:polyphosphate kinase